MPRPNMISGNYNYLGVGGHYKSGIAGLGNVTQGELDNAGLNISEWQHLLANLNDDAAYGPGGYYAPGIVPKGYHNGLGLVRSDDPFGGYMAALDSPLGETPVGPGFIDYITDVEYFKTNPTQIYNVESSGQGTVGSWLKNNWMELTAGVLVALIVLPHARSRR